MQRHVNGMVCGFCYGKKNWPTILNSRMCSIIKHTLSTRTHQSNMKKILFLCNETSVHDMFPKFLRNHQWKPTLICCIGNKQSRTYWETFLTQCDPEYFNEVQYCYLVDVDERDRSSKPSTTHSSGRYGS